MLLSHLRLSFGKPTMAAHAAKLFYFQADERETRTMKVTSTIVPQKVNIIIADLNDDEVCDFMKWYQKRESSKAGGALPIILQNLYDTLARKYDNSDDDDEADELFSKPALVMDNHVQHKYKSHPLMAELMRNCNLCEPVVVELQTPRQITKKAKTAKLRY
jgi:hypothetical protein